MRIAQIILPDASEYERKSQRADQAALSEKHDVTVTPIESIADVQADLAHVYAGRELPASAFVRFPLPYVASSDVRPSRWSWRRPVRPRFVVSPLGDDPLPEVVEERYFSDASRRKDRPTLPKIIGSFGRSSVRNSVEQTMARIRRFRDDVDWQIYESQPSPEDLASVDAWIDPAVDETDFDGYVAEALIVGLPVVATRTAINVLRLEQGRTGFLVPPRDPNEMTHAILSALFKTEVAESRQFAGRQTVSKFRARQRLRILNRLYQIVTNA
ncbi:MAG: glycosyltransferase [Acidobacteriota bacterium]|nr:glycosyltransferase [Acidobacteriota bacterium]